MVTYYNHTGEIFEAQEFLKTHGGMLFPPKTSDHHTVVVRGEQVHTFFPPDSLSRKQAYSLAKQWGLEEEFCERATMGRLAKWFIENHLQLPYQRTFFDKNYRKLAKEGYHWHYLMVEPKWKGYAFEWDIKSAYATSLSQFPTMLYHPHWGWLDDKGAMQRFRSALPYMPKSFRLCLLGTLASHQMRYFTLDKEKKDGSVKQVIQNKISYGSAFNAVHAAVYRVWATMKRAHELVGKYCKRIHTDSILWDLNAYESDIPEQLYNLFNERGFNVAQKRSGKCLLDDINSGIIGGQCIGAKSPILKLAYQEGFIPSTEPLNQLDGQLIGHEALKYDYHQEVLEKIKQNKQDNLKEELKGDEKRESKSASIPK